jgi:hypothetical protein
MKALLLLLPNLAVLLGVFSETRVCRGPPRWRSGPWRRIWRAPWT